MPKLTRRAWLLVAATVFLVAFAATFIVGQGLTASRSVRPDGFQRSADPRQIVVIMTVGVGDEVTEHSAREDASGVTVIVRVREPGGSRIALGVLIPVPITLREALGNRTVLDEGGRTVPDLGQYRGPGSQ